MSAIDDIAAERRRQVEQEGWTAEHDANEHGNNELLSAAACYLDHAAHYGWIFSTEPDSYRSEREPDCWPWHDFWKPKDPRRDLVRAAALIAAEIDRMDGGLPTSEIETAYQKAQKLRYLDHYQNFDEWLAAVGVPNHMAPLLHLAWLAGKNKQTSFSLAVAEHALDMAKQMIAALEENAEQGYSAPGHTADTELNWVVTVDGPDDLHGPMSEIEALRKANDIGDGD